MIQKLLLQLLIYFFITVSFAQQGKVDQNFNTLDDGLNGDGFNSSVRTLFLQPDKKLLVGGDFESLNGSKASHLTRLNPEGTIDAVFDTGTGFNGKVYSCFAQSDGKIVAAGNFTNYNGNSCGRVVRLNADGSYDQTFNTSLGATTGIIYNIFPQTDGKIILVGSFTKYNGVTVNRIARILTDGTLDSSFVTGIGFNFNSTNVFVLADGKILVTGNFTSFNGIRSNKIARLNSDGSIDTSFNIGTGFNHDVNALLVQPDGKIVLSGKFTDYNGNPANRIIRLNADATIDIQFLSGSGFNADGVQVIKSDASGNIMLGGSFTGFYNASEVNRIVFLNPDGTLKTDFEINSGPKSGAVLALETDSDGSWYLGGSFVVFEDKKQGRLAKINANGEHETDYLSAGIGFDTAVLEVIPLVNKKAMVFGSFTKFNGEIVSRIARITEDGTLDKTFNAMQSGANNLIKSAVLQTDHKIVFGGNFTKYNDTNGNRLVRILPDGDPDPTFNVGLGFNNQVYSLVLQTDQKIIAAGNFTSFNNAPAFRIVRLLPDGSRDTTFNTGSGANGVVEAIVLQPDGKILIGGRFTSFNGIPFSRLVRLNADGSIDTSFTIGTGFDKNVYAMALQSNQKIIVGGAFLNFNGTSQKRLLRLHPNGTLDSTFESGSGFSKGDVLSILIQPDDRILAGGTFTKTYKNTACLRLIRLQESGEHDPSFQADLNNKLHTMHFTFDKKLFIGGDFNSVSGISKHRIARLKLCLEETVWNSNSWSNGLPSLGKQIIFNDNYSNLKTTEACSCIISAGKTVTLLSKNTLGLDLDYGGSGTLVLEDSACLYQADDEIVNNGVIHLKRKSTPILKSDYTYWSAPVSNQKLEDVFSDSSPDGFYSFDAKVKNWKKEDHATNMHIAQGYIVEAPQHFSEKNATVYEAIFKGIPNNGKINIKAETDDSFNLIGNPYPSAINSDLFLMENQVAITGALYFWTHNTPITNNKYNSDDYAVYNLLGGVGTRNALSSGINQTIPDGTISSGQAFFVKSKTAGTIKFDDKMRIKERNSIFFKVRKSNDDKIEKGRVWLNLSNAEGAFKQILIGYIHGATNGYDESFDAVSFNGNQYVDFYSITENKKLVIQGRALPFAYTDSIALGYKAMIAGSYTIAINHLDGFLKNKRLYLEDKKQNSIHDLNNSDYTFSTAAGAFRERFVLRFEDSKLLVEDFKRSNEGILFSVKNKIIKIKSEKQNIDQIVVFDTSGKCISKSGKIDTTEYQITNLLSSNGILIVKVTLENESVVTKKIVF